MQIEQIRELAERRGFPMLSLYFPTVVKGPETRQNAIHLKNALAEAREQLEQAGMEGREIDALFSPAMEKLDDESFWSHQSRGLALFIEPERILWHQLDDAVEELVVVADRYHIRPLINAASGGVRFYLLALTRDHVAFYECDEHQIRPRKVENCRESIGELRGKTAFEGNVGFHANERGGRTGGAEGTPQYHGQGRSPEDYDAVLFEHFVRDIANAVDAHLANATAPLVLAGDARAVGHIRNHLKYEGLAGKAVNRNPGAMSEDALHEAAFAIVRPGLRADREAALERLEASLNDSGIPGSSDLKELVRAGVEGRVDTLFVSPDAHVWGSYDRASHDITVEDEPGAGNLDLLDFIAVKTLTNGGRVYPLPESKANAIGPAAGVFRF